MQEKLVEYLPNANGKGEKYGKRIFIAATRKCHGKNLIILKYVCAEKQAIIEV